MPIDHILDEIKKREEQKEFFINQLLSECTVILEKLDIYSDSTASFQPARPPGVVGRRLGDKLANLKNNVDELSKIERCSLSDLQKIENSLELVMNHLENYNTIFNKHEPVELPDSVQEIKNQFLILQSLEKNLKSNYVEHCISELKQKINFTNDKMSKIEIKQTYDLYISMNRFMHYDSISRLKSLNDEFNDILSPGAIAREYKRTQDRLFVAKEDFETASLDREKFKNVAKHLSHLKKCETRSKVYVDEVDKLVKKLELIEEDSHQEIEDLISSYKEAQKIMQDETLKVKTLISTEFGITDEDEYHTKSNNIQITMANLEIEIKKLEKKSVLLEGTLQDIHDCRRKAMSVKSSLNINT